MLYIGFYLEIPEAIRILGLEEDSCKNFYDTWPIHTYLKEKNSPLQFLYMDKGTCMFGVPVSDGYIYEVEELLQSLLTAKKAFWKAVKDLGLDLSTVTVTGIEEESVTLENPQPFVINYNC